MSLHPADQQSVLLLQIHLWLLHPAGLMCLSQHHSSRSRISQRRQEMMGINLVTVKMCHLRQRGDARLLFVRGEDAVEVAAVRQYSHLHLLFLKFCSVTLLCVRLSQMLLSRLSLPHIVTTY